MDYIRDTRKQVFMMNDEYLNGYAKICGIYATGVYVSLCRHASKQQVCFPSKKLIAEELSISERQVYDSLKMLENWNIIKIEKQGRKKDGAFLNHVYVLLDKSVWKDKENQPQAYCADGISGQEPQANQDIHRRHIVPNKDTHIEGYTFKDTHTAKEENSPLAVADKPRRTPQGEFITAWKAIYKAETGQEYSATGKDYVLVTAKIKEFGLETITLKTRLLFELCKNHSAWFAKGGMADFTIGKLSSHWNEIIEEVKGNGKQVGISRSELADFLSGRD